MFKWEDISDIDTAKSYILGDGKKDPSHFDSDNFLIPLLQEVPRESDYLLDLGCGIGRNLPFFTKQGFDPVGFDLPNMVQLARQYLLDDYCVTDNWKIVRDKRYDVVVAMISLQHMEEITLQYYLHDMQLFCKRMILHTRSWHDHFRDISVLEYVLNCGWRLVEFCNERVIQISGSHLTAILEPAHIRLSKNN